MVYFSYILYQALFQASECSGANAAASSEVHVSVELLLLTSEN
jgi:hypothetical protein